MTENLLAHLQSALGIVAIIALAWALSENRRAFRFRMVGAALLLQLAIALLLLKFPPARAVLLGLNEVVNALSQATIAGATFVFGYVAGGVTPFSVTNPRALTSFAFGVLRFAFPWPGFTPCTWLTTLSRDDLIERAGAVSTAKLSEIDDALRASEQRTAWTPAAAARLSEIKDSLRRRTQADGEGTDAHADEGRSRPHDRRSAAPQQQDHELRLEY